MVNCLQKITHCPVVTFIRLDGNRRALTLYEVVEVVVCLKSTPTNDLQVRRSLPAETYMIFVSYRVNMCGDFSGADDRIEPTPDLNIGHIIGNRKKAYRVVTNGSAALKIQ